MFGGRRLVAKFALGPKKTSFRLEFEFQSDECASCWMFRSLDAPRWAMYADSSDKPWGQQELDHAVWGKPTDAAIERFLRDAGIEDVVVEEAKEAKDAATRRRWTYAKVLCLARRALMEKHGEGGCVEGAENGVYDGMGVHEDEILFTFGFRPAFGVCGFVNDEDDEDDEESDSDRRHERDCRPTEGSDSDRRRAGDWIRAEQQQKKNFADAPETCRSSYTDEDTEDAWLARLKKDRA